MRLRQEDGGTKKFPMEKRATELVTKGGERGWWTEIAKTQKFHLAAKIMAIETRDNSWARVVFSGKKAPFIVHGLNKPFVYQKVLDHSIVCDEKAYAKWKNQ
jgi:hypothetical protein